MRPLSSTPLDIRGMGEAAYSLPLWQQYQMRDLIAQATCDRDSLAYWSDTGRTYAVDELRRRRTRAGYLAKIEEAGTRLNDRDLTTWTDNSGGSGSASATVNADGSYRITLFSGDSYGGVLRESFAALASDGSFRCEAKLVSGSTQYLSIKFGSGDPTGQSDAINSPVLDPDTWTELTSSPVSGRSSVEFQARGPTESGVLDNTIEIDVRFVQVEQNPYPTSWIPGPGTARAAGNPGVDLGSNPLPATGWTAVVTGQSLWLPTQTTGQKLAFAAWTTTSLTGASQVEVLQNSGGENQMRFGVRDGAGYLSQLTSAAYVSPTNRVAYCVRAEAAQTVLRIYDETGLREQIINSKVAANPLRYIGCGARPGGNGKQWDGTIGLKIGRQEYTDAQLDAIAADELARLP
jgi:hypothetical protein